MGSLKQYKQDDEFIELVNMDKLNDIVDSHKESNTNDTFYLSKDQIIRMKNNHFDTLQEYVCSLTG